MGGLGLPRIAPLPTPVPKAFPVQTVLGQWQVWRPASSPGSRSVTPGELLGLKLPQPQPCPTLSPTASSPPAPAPGLWDSERAEGLALHTNVRPIVKAPLCPRAPLRRLWGGHNGGSVPKFPQTVTCFQSLPQPPLTRPSVRRAQRAWGSGPGVGWGGESMWAVRHSPHFGQAGEMDIWQG